jgi:chlorobactene glucosyltransferase
MNVPEPWLLLAVLAAGPWLTFPVLVASRVRRRPLLDSWSPAASADAPRVSVIVPARDEAETIGACVASLRRSTYPTWEAVVVDDRSVDGTAAIARAAAKGDARIRVVPGEPLPGGWFGKPWACTQGAHAATGEYLLFTDADVVHEPELVGRAISMAEAEGAGLVSVLPRHVLGGFWERLIMPHVLFLILLRYPDPARVNASERTRDKIANGQFILVRRDAYEAVGGHGSVRREVVEDLRLAQRFHEAGERVVLAVADRYMAVRMYRTLGGIVEGWSKNVASGARHAVPEWIGPLVPWLLVGWLVLLWLVPPATLAFALVGLGGVELATWSAIAVGASLLLWLVVLGRLGVPRAYAVLYPAGAAIAAAIFLKSAAQGDRVRWKGRTYRTSAGDLATDREPAAERPGSGAGGRNASTPIDGQ